MIGPVADATWKPGPLKVGDEELALESRVRGLRQALAEKRERERVSYVVRPDTRTRLEKLKDEERSLLLMLGSRPCAVEAGE